MTEWCASSTKHFQATEKPMATPRSVPSPFRRENELTEWFASSTKHLQATEKPWQPPISPLSLRERVRVRAL